MPDSRHRRARTTTSRDGQGRGAASAAHHLGLRGRGSAPEPPFEDEPAVPDGEVNFPSVARRFRAPVPVPAEGEERPADAFAALARGGSTSSAAWTCRTPRPWRSSPSTASWTPSSTCSAQARPVAPGADGDGDGDPADPPPDADANKENAVAPTPEARKAAAEAEA